MKSLTQLTFFLLLIVTFQQLSAQNTYPLKAKIAQIVSQKQATVGVAISNIKDTNPTYLHKNRHFVMQSVFKLPIALFALHKVDQGKMSLDQKVQIKKEDLLPHTWSPIREKYPNGTIMSLAKLIQYTVAQSDNNGCDILLRMLGGPLQVEQYFHKIGIKNLAFKVNEETMHRDKKAQYKNWITPKAANKLLRLFYFNQKQLLEKKTYTFIWGVLKDTKTDHKKFRGQLPADAVIAHKTGSSGQNDLGITTAENDIGVIFLPNGNPLFVSVFITASKETPDTNKQIIAEVAKAAWDYYTN